MPTYEYICKACGEPTEHFASMSAKPLKKCPHCGKNQLERQIGTGAGFIFKGGGFYETDYRSEGYKKAASEDKAPASSQGDAAEKTDKKADKAGGGSASGSGGGSDAKATPKPGQGGGSSAGNKKADKPDSTPKKPASGSTKSE